MKTCTKCGEEKPLSEYYKKATGRGGVASRCKACQVNYERMRVWIKIWGNDKPYQAPPIVESDPEFEIVNLPIPDEYSSIGPLVCAVIISAAKDAMRGDFGARYWLRTEGVAWAGAIGIDLRKTIPNWIENGCQIEPHAFRGMRAYE